MTILERELDNELMQAALAEATRSNCVSRQVGAVIALGERIISAGFNGVPEFSGNCVDAGCPRCRTKDQMTGVGYDRCICVHAEQYAIAVAARKGLPVEGATLYSSLRPCITCLTNALAAGIRRVIFANMWRYEDVELENALNRLSTDFDAFHWTESNF